MERMTSDPCRAAAYHTALATNGIATVAGHLAKLRELTADPERDATYRQLLTDLGQISATIRALETERAA